MKFVKVAAHLANRFGKAVSSAGAESEAPLRQPLK